MTGKWQGRYQRKWTARKIAKVASWYVCGFTSGEMSAMLNDGTSAPSIRHQIHRWKLMPVLSRTHRPMMVRIPHRHTRWARKAARRRGMELPEMLGKIIEAVLDEGDECVDLLIKGD